MRSDRYRSNSIPLYTKFPTLLNRLINLGRSSLPAIIPPSTRNSGWVELGTIGSRAARDHAQRAEAAGIAYLDAPVINGGQPAAEAGTLKVLIGGRAEVLAQVDPVLRAFSTESMHMGPAGSAQTMKLVNNMLLAAISCASADALALAEHAGIGAERALDILVLHFVAASVINQFMRSPEGVRCSCPINDWQNLPTRLCPSAFVGPRKEKQCSISRSICGHSFCRCASSQACRASTAGLALSCRTRRRSSACRSATSPSTSYSLANSARACSASVLL